MYERSLVYITRTNSSKTALGKKIDIKLLNTEPSKSVRSMVL